MILNTETTEYGYRVSARGVLRADGATAWLEALRRRLDEETTTNFGLVIDVRGLEWDAVGAEVAIRAAFTRLAEAGIRRSAIVADHARPLLELRRLAQETGLYPSQRYFVASPTQQCERAAQRWVAEGQEETVARQGERRAELALLIESLGEALLLCDANGQVLHVNRAYERLVADDADSARLRREVERLARCGMTPPPGAQRTATGIEWEVSTNEGSYRLRRSMADEGIFGAAAAQLVAVQPVVGQPLSDDDLRTRFNLTAREIVVARLLAEGQTNVEIARQLGISRFTARNHTERVLAKLGVSNRAKVASALSAA